MTKLELKKLTSDLLPQREDLRQRALNNPQTEARLRYVVFRDVVEVAYLSFDLLPNADFLVLYELFVAKPFRRQGLGTEILRQAEAIAREHGRSRILIRPKPLALDISREQLQLFYQERGYQPVTEDRGLYQKLV